MDKKYQPIYATEDTIVRIMSALYSTGKILESTVVAYDDDRQEKTGFRLFTNTTAEAQNAPQEPAESQSNNGTQGSVEVAQMVKEKEEKPSQWHCDFLRDILSRWSFPVLLPYSTIIAEYRHTLKKLYIKPLDRRPFHELLKSFGYHYVWDKNEYRLDDAF